MIALLISASLLAGVGTTERMGEARPSLVLSADAGYRALNFEATWDSANKIETGDGWLSRVGADVRTGPLLLGAHWSHRQTGEWTKDRLFVRAGVRHQGVSIFAEVAPNSPNREAKLEARVRLAHKWLRLEPRAWVGTHSTSASLGGYSWGLTMLTGWGR